MIEVSNVLFQMKMKEKKNWPIIRTAVNDLWVGEWLVVITIIPFQARGRTRPSWGQVLFTGSLFAFYVHYEILVLNPKCPDCGA